MGIVSATGVTSSESPSSRTSSRPMPRSIPAIPAALINALGGRRHQPRSSRMSSGSPRHRFCDRSCWRPTSWRDHRAYGRSDPRLAGNHRSGPHARARQSLVWEYREESWCRVCCQDGPAARRASKPGDIISSHSTATASMARSRCSRRSPARRQAAPMSVSVLTGRWSRTGCHRRRTTADQ